jgi:hypothetical protein
MADAFLTRAGAEPISTRSVHRRWTRPAPSACSRSSRSTTRARCLARVPGRRAFVPRGVEDIRCRSIPAYPSPATGNRVFRTRGQ